MKGLRPLGIVVPRMGFPVWVMLSVVAGMLVWSSGATAHPALSREPVSRMKAPGPMASLRAPLAVRPTKPYLPALPPPAPGIGGGIPEGLLYFYRNVISPVDGDRCVMAPTCSLYSSQALRSHGIVMGVILTADRLLHEADEIPVVPTLVERGEKLYLDPLASNTYWLWDWLK